MELLQRTDNLHKLTDAQLLQHPQPEAWSIAQVLEHLNSYNRYYLREIEIALQRARSKGVRHNDGFSPGWLGNYFTKMMEPGTNGVVAKKYKSPQDHAPSPMLHASTVLREFVAGEQRLIDFLQQGARSDMNGIRVPISISRMIRLKLGDTFRFLIAHQQRHFQQIERLQTNIAKPDTAGRVEENPINVVAGK